LQKNTVVPDIASEMRLFWWRWHDFSSVLKSIGQPDFKIKNIELLETNHGKNVDPI